MSWLDHYLQQLPKMRTPEELDGLSNVVQSAVLQCPRFISHDDLDRFSAERDRYLAQLRKGEPDGQQD